MRVLVTGGLGFIGSHLAEALCEKGCEVVILDNFSNGTEENLAWRKPGSRLEVVRGDIQDQGLINRVIPGCSWVFHSAAIASVPASVDDPLKTNGVNLDATLKLLIASRDHGIKRFLFASSSAVYGDSPTVKKKETDPPKPLTPYGLQKYAAERYCQIFFELYGLPTVCFRYFNVFGPRQSFNSPYSGVIARFCNAFLSEETPRIFGDGKQSRDFVSVRNVVAANLLGAERPVESVGGKVFNIGAGRSVNLLGLIEELNRQLGRHVIPDFAPARSGDVRDSEADISEAVSGLGYSPKSTWQEGLGDTLAFYKKCAKSD